VLDHSTIIMDFSLQVNLIWYVIKSTRKRYAVIKRFNFTRLWLNQHDLPIVAKILLKYRWHQQTGIYIHIYGCEIWLL